VVNYEQETFYPGQAQQLYDLLQAPKVFTTLTAAEGAQLHCSPMAPQRQAEVVFDYLEDTVGRAEPAVAGGAGRERRGTREDAWHRP
jgi:hypothetical protein